MNRAQLIEKVALGLRVEKVVAEESVLMVLNTIAAEVMAGNRVELFAFGSFERRHSKARTCRNPRTGETLAIPPKKTVKFRASSLINRGL